MPSRPTRSPMTFGSVMAAAALLTIVALGCVLSLSLLLDNNNKRLRPPPARMFHDQQRTSTIERVRQLRPVAFMRNVAQGHRKLESRDNTDRDQHRREPLSLALVRPISVHDAENLVNSFIYWDEFVPGSPGTDGGCRSNAASDGNAKVDLIISFSRVFDDERYPDIIEALDRVNSLFDSTGGWGGCIQSVKMFEVNIPPDEDLYDPALAEQGDRMWANGPNRQFEKTFRFVQSLDEYDVLFLMESDTYPAADGWLDLLIEEVKSKAPFALLGSKYNGHAWDEFANEMPLALLHHVNGNAIYNTTHVLLDNIVSELEEEAETWYNAITYDYRISQILLEGSSGTPPDFPYTNIVDAEGNQIIRLQPKTDKFKKWWDECSGDYGVVQESRIMTNLGSTAYLPGDVDDGIALVHGKNMYLPWDTTGHGSVGLVISDWGEMDAPFKDFLYKLNASDHPFSEIILMVSLDSDDLIHNVSEWVSSTFDFSIVVKNRTEDASMDLCQANATTDFFMMSDVDHEPSENIGLMVASDGSNRPIAPYVSSESVHCASYQSCERTIREARKYFLATMGRYFFSDEMLFGREFVQSYCDELRHYQKNQNSHSETDDFDAGGIRALKPTATSYFAHLQRKGVAESNYFPSNVVIEGTKKPFVLAQPKVPVALKHHVADLVDRTGIDRELPVLWHIPKSGGSSMKVLLSHCLGRTVAASSGVMIERRSGILRETEYPDHLYIVRSGMAAFVSVDVSSPRGIARARDLDLVGSGIADALVTPLLSKAVADVFAPEAGRRARIFTVMRHPIDRAVSLFYYLQNATWERTYDPTLQNMTLEEYAVSIKAESNWMVQMLNNEPPGLIDERHLGVAKQLVREKVLIGLTEDMEESVKRFYSYFGWENGGENSWGPCERRLLFGGGVNSNRHQSLERGGKAWNLLASRNSLDVALYDYAVELFEVQGLSLFSKNGTGQYDAQKDSNSDFDADGVVRQALDLNTERQLDLNVADGDIAVFGRHPTCVNCANNVFVRSGVSSIPNARSWNT